MDSEQAANIKVPWDLLWRIGSAVLYGLFMMVSLGGS